MKTGENLVTIKGDLAEVVRDLSSTLCIVLFTGQTAEGKFNGKRGMMITALKVNCVDYRPNNRSKSP